MNKLLLTLPLLLAFGLTLHAQDSTSTSVYFATSKWELTPAAKAELDSLCQALKAQPTAQVFLTGHTDSRGTVGANDTLSRRRVNAVRSYLNGCGQKGVRLRTDADGELRPIATNATPKGMSQNRRVEITVVIPEPEPSIDDAELEALLAPLRPKVQRFSLRCDTVQELVGAEGTVIVLPANTFPCSDSLTLELMECYDKASILAMKLTTETEGGLLQTGGMVHVKALVKGQEIKPRGEYMVLMPTDAPNAQMSTYYSTLREDKAVKWPSKGAISGQKVADRTWAWVPVTERVTRLTIQRKGVHKLGVNVANLFRAESDRVRHDYVVELSRTRIAVLDPSGAPLMTRGRTLYSNTWVTNRKVIKRETFRRMLSSSRASAELQYNALWVQQTGWVNCDFFLREENARKVMPVATTTNLKGPSQTVMFFKDYDVVMRGLPRGKFNAFKNIPNGEPVIVVGYRKGRNGLEASILETKVTADMQMPEYRPISSEEFREVVNKIGVDPLAGQ